MFSVSHSIQRASAERTTGSRGKRGGAARENNVSFNLRNTFIFNSIINDLLAAQAGYCSPRDPILRCVKKRFLNYSPFYTGVFSIHVPRRYKQFVLFIADFESRFQCGLVGVYVGLVLGVLIRA